jgi:hypothetical protein
MWSGQRQLVMQEILSMPGAENLPLSEQVLYELSIEESEDIWRPGFVVSQTLYRWSKIDHDFMCEEPEWERWPTLKKAQEKYDDRLKMLRAKGFTYSDMDLI